MIKLNLVDNINEVKDPGDPSTYINKHSQTGKSIVQLIVCCPGCGKVSGSHGNHIYDKETQSYKPSIEHVCGWHGWLKNGWFKAE